MRASPEKLTENIWFHSLQVAKVGWLRTGYQGCVRAIRRKILEIAPDIVHGQGTERECALGAVFSGFPNVVTIHGNMAAVGQHERSAFAKFYSRCAAFLEAVALRRTQGVFCNSAYTESLVRRHCRQTWRVPNALREAFFAASAAAPADKVPILLNIGVVSPRKRQVELLDLARDLHAVGLRFVLNFVGSLDRHSAYGRAFHEKLVAARDAGYANYLGSLDVPGLISLMDSASALIHVPSEEAFGLVIAEALARNLKVFATNVGGIVDIASGVEGTELFGEGDWGHLAEAMKHWIQSGAPRPRNAATKMTAHYHPLVVARQHLNIYREVLGRAAARANLDCVRPRRTAD
jgi:glycosyltransferase involved in cell wall biosynthesis